MEIMFVGIDHGKNSCSVAGIDATGRVRLRKRLARELTALGHDVRLMSPEYVRQYVKAQKNDKRDAEGAVPTANSICPIFGSSVAVANRTRTGPKCRVVQRQGQPILRRT